MIENGVYIGREGWLFLVGGSNDVGALFSPTSSITDEEISVWINILANRKRKINSLGAIYKHFWIPDKLSVYQNYIDSELTLNELCPSELVLEYDQGRIFDVVIDILSVFRDQRSTQQLYWKTDTHWTYAGAYSAYEIICHAISAIPLLELKHRKLHETELALDLGSKLTPIIKEKWSVPKILENCKITYKNELVRFIEILAPRYQSDMHTGTSVIYENESTNCDPRKILIFGDSYCEYRPQSLAALLGETFRSVQFVWSNSIDYSLIESFQPDLVLTEMAERFIRRVPDDKYVLASAGYAKIADFLNRQCGPDVGYRFSWTESET